MSNQDKLIDAVSRALDIAPGKVTDDLTYNTIAEWDSVAHMSLVAALETSFDIMLDTDDIIDMSSIGKIRDILGKYNIAFEA